MNNFSFSMTPESFRYLIGSPGFLDIAVVGLSLCFEGLEQFNLHQGTLFIVSFESDDLGLSTFFEGRSCLASFEGHDVFLSTFVDALKDSFLFITLIVYLEITFIEIRIIWNTSKHSKVK